MIISFCIIIRNNLCDYTLFILSSFILFKILTAEWNMQKVKECNTFHGSCVT